MLYKNAKYPNKDFIMTTGDIEIKDGKITNIGNNLPYKESDMVVDCDGFYIFPAYIDIYSHKDYNEVRVFENEIILNSSKLTKTKILSLFKKNTDKLIFACEDLDDFEDVIDEEELKDIQKNILEQSIFTLHKCFLKIVSCQIPMEQALKVLCYNPAISLGIDEKTGSIEKEKNADLLILDNDLNIVAAEFSNE